MRVKELIDFFSFFYDIFSAAFSLSLFHVVRCAIKRSKVKGSAEEKKSKEKKNEFLLLVL